MDGNSPDTPEGRKTSRCETLEVPIYDGRSRRNPARTTTSQITISTPTQGQRNNNLPPTYEMQSRNEIPGNSFRPRYHGAGPAVFYYADNIDPRLLLSSTLPRIQPRHEFVPSSNSRIFFTTTPYSLDTSCERQYSVRSFSYRTQTELEFPALFSERFKYSVVCPSVLEELGIESRDLPPNNPQYMVSPLGLMPLERYVGMVIMQPDLGIKVETGVIHVLDGLAPPNSPKIYFGEPFLKAHFGGELPRPPPQALIAHNTTESYQPAPSRPKRQREKTPEAGTDRRCRRRGI